MYKSLTSQTRSGASLAGRARTLVSRAGLIATLVRYKARRALRGPSPRAR
ncbi:hypothetical protein BH11MYX4_BH11MYX4_47280 [soil metagenome]